MIFFSTLVYLMILVGRLLAVTQHEQNQVAELFCLYGLAEIVSSMEFQQRSEATIRHTALAYNSLFPLPLYWCQNL